MSSLAIGALGYGLSITLWVTGVRELGAARGQLIVAIALFVGAVCVWTVLGEPVTTSQIVALALAMIGVTSAMHSVHMNEHRRRRRQP